MSFALWSKTAPSGTENAGSFLEDPGWGLGDDIVKCGLEKEERRVGPSELLPLHLHAILARESRGLPAQSGGQSWQGLRRKHRQTPPQMQLLQLHGSMWDRILCQTNKAGCSQAHTRWEIRGVVGTWEGTQPACSRCPQLWSFPLTMTVRELG
jgi:hypothetical protein